MILDVWDFALPNETHLPGDIWNGSMKNMRPEEEMAYYQLARQHRFVPLVYAYRPALRVAGTQVTLAVPAGPGRVSARVCTDAAGKQTLQLDSLKVGKTSEH